MPCIHPKLKVKPTSKKLAAGGGKATWGFRMLLATGGVQRKSEALLAAGRPVLDSVPGYVLATDMTTAALYVHPPAAAGITSVTVVNDAPSARAAAIHARDDNDGSPCMSAGTPTPLKLLGRDARRVQGHAGAQARGGWMSVKLTPIKPHCRCRVELHYSDGTFQVASYYTLPPMNKHLANFGGFQAKTTFYEDEADPFGRAPSFMYERQSTSLWQFAYSREP